MLIATTVRMLCVAAFLVVFVSSAGAQVTVYNNFGPEHNGWDYNYGMGWTVAGVNVPAQYGVEQAMGFQSTASGTVTDIWVAIFYVPLDTLPDQVTIKLANNPQGLPPDSADVMEEWVITEFESWSQWSPPHHLQGSGTSQLQEGANYWLWAVGGETTWCGWCLNINPTLTCPHTLRREGENWLPISNETASAFRVDLIQTGPLSVTLTPASLPIQIPSGGGRFDFNIAVANSGTASLEVDVWTMVTLPDSSEYGPIILVENFTLAAGQTVNRDRTQSVPGAAPAGMYTYDAYLGTFPDTVLSEDLFDWEKLATGDGAAMTWDWPCWGESFTAETTDSPGSMPESVVLHQAYPNPFNPTTSFRIKLPAAGWVRLEVYDINGRIVGARSPRHYTPGVHQITFDGSGLASGIYLYQLRAGNFTASGKMVLMK